MRDYTAMLVALLRAVSKGGFKGVLKRDADGGWYVATTRAAEALDVAPVTMRKALAQVQDHSRPVLRHIGVPVVWLDVGKLAVKAGTSRTALEATVCVEIPRQIYRTPSEGTGHTLMRDHVERLLDGRPHAFIMDMAQRLRFSSKVAAAVAGVTPAVVGHAVRALNMWDVQWREDARKRSKYGRPMDMAAFFTWCVDSDIDAQAVSDALRVLPRVDASDRRFRKFQVDPERARAPADDQFVHDPNAAVPSEDTLEPERLDAFMTWCTERYPKASMHNGQRRYLLGVWLGIEGVEPDPGYMRELKRLRDAPDPLRAELASPEP